jgi:hypothetical protein
MLQETAGGLGAIALGWLLHNQKAVASETAHVYDLLPKKPHFAPKAKNVIFLYMGGGPSTIDMFDPKPALRKYDGQNAPFEIKGRALNGSQKVMASPFDFKAYGQSGRLVSDLLPNFTRIVDDVTFVRGMTTDRIDHSTAQFTFISGRGIAGFPSIGSWVSYGLGTDNHDLPAFIALEDSPATIKSRAYGSAWLPPIYQGTRMNGDGAPMFDVARPADVTAKEQMQFLESVNEFNRMHKEKFPADAELDTRIANFELAARMQVSAMQVADLSKESEATKKLYGMDNPTTRDYGARCLLARRLVENGVRFVTVINGGWDHHSNLKEDISRLCARTDCGAAALITDLKSRGLLDSTLVIWSGEFGRLPTIEAATAKPGRDHNPYGFALWMAGGGIRSGFDFGQTDDLGYAAEGSKLTHSDIHATILHQLGLDYKKLTFEYEGRAESLVGINPARVINEILV